MTKNYHKINKNYILKFNKTFIYLKNNFLFMIKNI